MIKKKIKYKVGKDGWERITPCPNRKMKRVGSYACSRCDFFIKDNRKKQYVVCSNPKSFRYEYPEILINFLKYKKTPQGKSALKRFIKYTEKYPNGVVKINKLLKTDDAISCSLLWSTTKEGLNYWYSLYQEYNKYFEENQKELTNE